MQLKSYHFYSGSNDLKEFFIFIRFFFYSFFYSNHNLEKNLTKSFNSYLGSNDTFFFASGRMALFSILKSLDIGEGDEVIIPAYTCVVVPNAIIYRSAKPIYVDINLSDFNLNVNQIEKLITKKTKAIYAQHTFGNRCNMKKLRSIANKYGLFLIEDSAHLIEKNQILKSDADVTFFSTDRSKILNTYLGGFVASNNTAIINKLKKNYKEVSRAPTKIAWHMYLSYILEFILLSKYFYFFGRYIHAFLAKIKIIFFFKDELKLTIPSSYPYPCKMAPGIMFLLCNQLKIIDKNLSHRKKISSYLYSQLTGRMVSNQKSRALLRYSMLVKDRSKMMKIFGKIDFNIWFSSVTEGRYSNYDEVNYIEGSCPNAEYATKHIINFPTHLQIDISYLEKIFSKNKKLIKNLLH